MPKDSNWIKIYLPLIIVSIPVMLGTLTTLYSNSKMTNVAEELTKQVSIVSEKVAIIQNDVCELKATSKENQKRSTENEKDIAVIKATNKNK